MASITINNYTRGDLTASVTNAGGGTYTVTATVKATSTTSPPTSIIASSVRTWTQVFINGSYVGGSYLGVNNSKTYTTTVTQTSSAQSISVSAYFSGDAKRSSDGALISTGSGNVQTSVTVPALPVPSTPTIIYSANGGTGAPANAAWAANQDFTVSTTVPTREGYNFGGWSYVWQGVTYSVQGGEKIPAARRATTTLYAIWNSKFQDLTGWTISEQRSTQRWLGAAARILLADDSTDGAYHLLAEYSFYQFATGVNESLNIYKIVGSDDAIRENIYVHNVNEASGLTIVKDLGVFGYNETVETEEFYCRWFPSSGGSVDSNKAKASYTTPVQKFAITYEKNNDAATGTTPKTTKTAGIDVVVSSCGYELEDFHFVEWNTDANGTGFSYEPGQVFSTDADLILYAIWARNHSVPMFTNDPSMFRVTSANEEDDYGTFVRVMFNYDLGEDGGASGSYTMRYKLTTAEGWTETTPIEVNGATGTVSHRYTVEFSTDASYDIELFLTDAEGFNSAIAREIITRAVFPFDMYAEYPDGIVSVAIGCPAPETMPMTEGDNPVPLIEGALTVGKNWDVQLGIGTNDRDQAFLDAINAADASDAIHDSVASLKMLLSYALGGGGGGGCVEDSGGVPLSDYDFLSGTATWPTTTTHSGHNGWGWSEKKFSDGRLEKKVWTWYPFYGNAGSWQFVWKDIPTDGGTDFVSMPCVTISATNNNIDANCMPTVTAVRLEAKEVAAKSLCYCNSRIVSGQGRVLMIITLDGHWR